LALPDYTTGDGPTARPHAGRASLNRLKSLHRVRAAALRPLAAVEVPLRQLAPELAALSQSETPQTGEPARFAHGCAPVGPSGCGGGAALDQVIQIEPGAVETMNKKSIAPRVPVLYPPQVAVAVIAKAKWKSAVAVIWRSSVPKLHALKRGL